MREDLHEFLVYGMFEGSPGYARVFAGSDREAEESMRAQGWMVSYAVATRPISSGSRPKRRWWRRLLFWK